MTATLLIVVAAYYGSTVPVLSNWIGTHFGVAAGAIGVLFAAQSLGALLGAVPAGVLLDTKGARFTIVAGSVGLLVAYTVLAVARSFPLFWIAAVLWAVAYTMVGLAVPFYLLMLRPAWARRSFALGLVSSSAPGLVFPIMAERMLVAERTSLLVRLPPAIIAAATGLAAIAFATRLFSGRQSGEAPGAGASIGETAGGAVRPARRGPLRSFLRQVGPAMRLPRFWVFFVLSFLHGTADTFIHNWYPRFMRGTFDVLPIRPGVVLTLFSVAYVVSRVLLMILPDNFARRGLLVAPGLIGGTILFVGLQSSSPIIAAVSYPLAAFFWSWEMPSLLAEANRSFPHAMGTFQTIAHTVSYAMGIAFHSAAGFVVEVGVPLRLILTGFALFYIAFGVTAGIGLRDQRTASVGTRGG